MGVIVLQHVHHFLPGSPKYKYRLGISTLETAFWWRKTPDDISHDTHVVNAAEDARAMKKF
jgi:hypothetical protein